jgi:hypothetical protein
MGPLAPACIFAPYGEDVFVAVSGLERRHANLVGTNWLKDQAKGRVKDRLRDRVL